MTRATRSLAELQQRARRVLAEEGSGLHLRLLLVQGLIALLPAYSASRVRTALLRLAGFKIGPGTLFSGQPTIVGPGKISRRLVIGANCWFNLGCHFELGEQITIGDQVSCGQAVLILTSSHEHGPALRRAGALTTQPVQIGAGAWLGARCMILPGVSIGAGAVVAAGALVNHDVPANTLVAGVPARPLRRLDADTAESEG